MNRNTTFRSAARTFLIATTLLGAAALAGCQNNAQTGGLLGAGIGALAGQAIGGNTEATLIGAAVGGGAGYVVGNESDKANSRYDRRYNPNYDY